MRSKKQQLSFGYLPEETSEDRDYSVAYPSTQEHPGSCSNKCRTPLTGGPRESGEYFFL